MPETTQPWRTDTHPNPATCARTSAAVFHQEPALQRAVTAMARPGPT
ncbi:hypothetical protein [Streptomyces narbonensis]